MTRVRTLSLGALAAVAILLPGCTATQSGPPSTNPTVSAARPDADKPSVLPYERVVGRIVSVNPLLRFVVMDFPVRRIPVIEQRLNIYRNGQKVGEVKVTGPTIDTTLAGDITAGEAVIGDEVRED